MSELPSRTTEKPEKGLEKTPEKSEKKENPWGDTLDLYRPFGSGERSDAGVLKADGSLDFSGNIYASIFNTPRESQVPTSELKSGESRAPKDEVLSRVQGLPNQRDFRSATELFEARAGKDKLSDDEKSSFYGQVSRLLDGGSAAHKKLALQVLQQAADPTRISQGDYNTCAVASLEARTYSLYPASAARVVADVALNPKGRYTSTSGDITLENPSRAQGEARRPTEDGAMTHASQIFQAVATNLNFAVNNPKAVYYFLGQNERLVDKTTGKPILPNADHFPAVFDDKIRSISRMITGRDEGNDAVIAHPSLLAKDKVKPENLLIAKTPQDLEREITRLQGLNKLPVLVGVHTAHQPFYKDSGEGSMGGAGGEKGGSHMVTIRGILPADPSRNLPARILVDNQWTRKEDRLTPQRAIPLQVMHRAMMAPGFKS